MKFAINYSSQAAELLQAGKIELDYFKTPPWPGMIAEAEVLRPIAVHFNLRAGEIDDPDLQEIETFLENTSTQYVNTHLGIKPNELPQIPANDRPIDFQSQEVLERLLANVQKLVDYFGSDRVIVENIPFRMNENSSLMACAEPKIISQVVEVTGCGFLLDVSHARIAAHSFGMDPHDYIEGLPIQNLCELHFTGIHNWDGYLMDHLSILDVDWPWLEWVIARIKAGDWGTPYMLAFEYGGTGEFFERFSDPAVIADQVPRLFEYCHNGIS